MKIQQKVILSLGSNQGNRLENIEKCIQFIHQEIGFVVLVSRLYETPSWGFQSDAFYNCALLIHTHFSADKIYKKITLIEEKLGRVRHDNHQYEARVIDIDIIGIEEQIIHTNSLTIPHPQIQNRLFVLLPMNDLNLQWKHPILQKSIKELIKNCEDKSECLIISDLKSPSKKFTINHLNYITIEGNIGAGKTTLTTKIAEDFNAKMILERFADNPFLPKFYKDQNRYAFPLEMSFLADRYKQLTDDLSQFDLFKDFILSDYHIFKSLIFAKITLGEDEFRLYKTLFDIIHKEIPKPDLYIYLYQNTDRLIKNIKKRGRDYEQEIPENYLEKINRGYIDYINSQIDLKSLIIDVSEFDFLKNPTDYIKVLEMIQDKINSI